MNRRSRGYVVSIALGVFVLLVEYVGCGGLGKSSGSMTLAASASASEQEYENTFYSFTHTQGCVQCHDGAVPTAPPFASSDINLAYNTAKGLVNFYNPDSSIIIQYSGNSHCGVGSICGVATNPGQVQTLLEQWAAAEIADGTAGPKVNTLPTYMTPSQPIPANLPSLTSNTKPDVIRFDLSTVTPALPQLSGVILEVEINLLNPSEYKIANVKIAGNTSTLKITGIHLFVNPSTATSLGAEDINGMAWDTLQLTAPATALPNPLPTGPMNVTPLTPVPNYVQMQSSSDVLTIGFDKIQ